MGGCVGSGGLVMLVVVIVASKDLMDAGKGEKREEGNERKYYCCLCW